MITLYQDVYESPIGRILFLTDGECLAYLDFEDCQARASKLLTIRYKEYIIQTVQQADIKSRLSAYFNKEWDAFDEIKLKTIGTIFQERVWKQLKSVKAGDTVSYTQLARMMGNHKAIRAAASANANNPISIIIPCHRVIGQDRSLRGYAGGLHRKRWLLKHEGVNI